MSGAPIFPSTRLRGTPFTKKVEEAGVAGYTIYNHMLLPVSFYGLDADCSHLKEFVQLWDVSVERQVQLKGPDAHKLACLISARDLRKAVVGRCYYAPICDAKGGMINDPVALRIADDCWWFSISDSDMLLWAEGIAYGMGLDVAVTEPDVSPLAVQGPLAEDCMVDMFGESIRDIKFFRFAEYEFQGVKMNIARSGWSKQGGFEIYLNDKTLGGALWDALMEKGEKYNMRAGCPNLIERLEGSLLSYGSDMDKNTTPLEAGLDRFCALDSDAEFIGKDALLAKRAAGLKRRIMGVKVDGYPMEAVGLALPCRVDGKRIGNITSGVYSVMLDQNIAFAMLDIDYAKVGQVIEVETETEWQTGVVCELGDLAK